MKNFGILILFGWLAFSCVQSDVQPKQNDFQNAMEMPKEILSNFERQSLILMREEEKMAGDVYSFLYAKWGINIFSNISKSERTHSDAMLALLEKYQISDPVGNNPSGVFTNTNLQSLYTELILKGSESVTAALEVGATIEDLDIFDLMEAQKYIDNQDINQVYANLTKGSRNHIRSFVARLSDYGLSYKAQYVDAKLLDEILNTPLEKGGI